MASDPNSEVFEGPDGFDGQWRAVVVALISLLGAFSLADRRGWVAGLLLLLGGVGLALLVWRGARYRLRVSPDGLTLTRTVWGLSLRRHRFPLDAEIVPFEAWEDDVPEAVAIEPPHPRWGPYPDAQLFGPYSGGRDPSKVPAIEALYEAVRAAVGRARALAPTRSAAPSLVGLGPGDVEVLSRHASGRIAELRLRTARVVLGHALPPGARLSCNLDLPQDWVSPDRPDALSAIRSPAPLSLPGGLTAPPETRVALDREGRVREVEAVLGAPTLHGWPLDPAAPLRFDVRGRIEAGTLAVAQQVGSLALLPGDQLEMQLLRSLVVRLSEAREVSGLTLPARSLVTLKGRPPRLALDFAIVAGSGRARHWRGDRWQPEQVRLPA